jgi:outer membrane receptor protein involved in Fe transport
VQRPGARSVPIALLTLIVAGGVSGEEEEALPVPAPVREEPIEEFPVLGMRTGIFGDSPAAFSSSALVDDFDAEGKRLEDLLALQPGVQIRRFGGPGSPSEISIRGSTGSQVGVRVDGVRVNSVLSGSSNLSQFCLGMLDAVEVSRGGGSIQAGGGSIGGVVSLETRRPGPEPVNRIQFTASAFDTFEVTALRTARAEHLEYTAGYCGFTTEGDYRFAPAVIRVATQPPTDRPITTRINNERVRHSANIGLGTNLGRRSHIRLHDYLTYSSHGEPGLDAGNDPLAGQNPFAHGRDVHNLARLEWTAEDLGAFGTAFEASLHHRYQRNQFSDPGTSESDEPVDLTTRVHSFGGKVQDAWRGHRLGIDHDFSLRVDARHDLVEGTERSAIGRSTVGVSLQEDARLLDERVVVVPAFRAEWTEGFDTAWLPGLGIVLSPVSWLRLKGNVQRSFRAPSFDELYLPDKGFIRGNPTLDAETALNADAGLEFVFDVIGPIRDLRFEGNVFLQDIDDSIVWVPISLRTVAPVNTGPAEVRGYELALSLNVTRFLRIFVNHIGLESESVRTGLPLVGRAESETNLRIELGERRVWKLVGELQHTGRIPASPSGSRWLPARSVWNASASVNLAGVDALGLHRWLGELWLYAALNNIGDVAVRDLLFFPQPGRNGHLGFQVQW